MRTQQLIKVHWKDKHTEKSGDNVEKINIVKTIKEQKGITGREN